MTNHVESVDIRSSTLNSDEAVLPSSLLPPSSQEREPANDEEAAPEQPRQPQSAPQQAKIARKARQKTTVKGVPCIPQGIDRGKEFRRDLTNMQFGTKQVREMANIKERRSCCGYPHKAEGMNGIARAVRAKREVKDCGGNGKYEHLRLAGDSNWVLFDPLRGYPAYSEPLDVARNPDPPLVILQFEKYKPGAVRIVEYNVVSEALRLRRTPKELAEGGKRIEYTTAGPRMVDYTDLSSTIRGTRRRISKQGGDSKIKSEPVEEVEEVASEVG